jgi:ASTRA-associated protein 1
MPSQSRRHTVRLASKAANNGMVMALSIMWVQKFLTLIAVYENGTAYVARLTRGTSWDVVYKSQSHSQPILSLDVAPDQAYFLTSGADAIIAQHPIPPPSPAVDTSSTVEDESSKTQGPVADPAETVIGPSPDPSLLPSSIASGRERVRQPITKRKGVGAVTEPVKLVNTKHSGQQSLRIRSDGKIFATAGWDSKIRVYSTKTISELAVLKWHEVGCYGVTFADTNEGAEKDSLEDIATAAGAETSSSGGVAARPQLGVSSVKDRRIKLASQTHWLAAGSKDGKVSLWDIY